MERGAVEIVKRTKSGERRLGVIPPGGLFGEMALLDGAPRMASARATTETVCRVVPRELVAAKLRSADPFLAALLRIMLANARSAAEAAVAEPGSGP